MHPLQPQFPAWLASPFLHPETKPPFDSAALTVMRSSRGHFSSFLPLLCNSILYRHTHTHLPLLFPRSLTCALAVLLVRLQFPAVIARTYDAELVLLAALTALQVFSAEALDLTSLVVSPQLHAQGAGTNDPLSGSHCAVMAALAVVQRTQVCR